MQRTSFEVVFLELQGLHLFSRAPEAVLRKSLELKVSVAPVAEAHIEPRRVRRETQLRLAAKAQTQDARHLVSVALPLYTDRALAASKVRAHTDAAMLS